MVFISPDHKAGYLLGWVRGQGGLVDQPYREVQKDQKTQFWCAQIVFSGLFLGGTHKLVLPLKV